MNRIKGSDVDAPVLIIDDDDKLRALLREYLEGYGYSVVEQPDGLIANQFIRERNPGIVILDIMLPGKNGLEILKDLRRDFAVPVIMLTAKGEDADRIVGLELGADDYLPKPFNPRELLARIKAVLRRTTESPAADKIAERPLIEAGGLVLDQAAMNLRVEGDDVVLSSTEFKILEAMMTRPDTVYTRDQLMNISRGRDALAFDRSVDVHISNLRAKLKPYPRHRKRIKTVWGAGYMFLSGS